MASIGEQIVAARKARGMTQDALAKALNISRATISNYETDRRLPDARTLLKLSRVLDYSFADEAGTLPEAETPAEAEADEARADRRVDSRNDAEAPDATAGPAADAAPAEEAADSRDVATAPAKARRIVVWAAAAAMVCVCVAIAVIRGGASNGAYYVAEDGARYTVEQFRRQAPREDDKAWLSAEPVVKVQRGENIDMWMYDLVFHEMNGVGMTVDRFAVYVFVGNAVHPQILSSDNLESSGIERAIAPYGDWSISGGLPVQDKVSGIGMELIGTDDNGASLTFTDYLKLNA